MIAGACPCGSGQAAATCCDPILAGAPAATALALMRSRYVAFGRGDAAYLLATHDASTRASVDRGALIASFADTAWHGLRIEATAAGGEADQVGEVEFTAYGAVGGARFAQRERSRFRRIDGRWFYLDGAPRLAPPLPRNAACPCGSGTKYKRCHGR